MKRDQPTTPDEWLAEIRLAIADARETKPFGLLTGQRITDANLFHLAPLVCMKFRGLDHRDEDLRKKVTEGALANYVANSDPDGIDHGLEQRPLMAFAICYIAAHYVLDLIDEEQATAALECCDEEMGRLMSEQHKIWMEQFEAARNIEDDFGTQKALEYLVGEKFLNFLEAAETDKDFRAEIPAFVEKIKTLFERWQLAAYLETAKETEPFDPKLFEPRDHPILGKEEIEFNAEEIEDMGQRNDLKQFGERTERVKARNKIAAEIMKERNIPTNDLYGLVQQHPDWHSGDGVHFNGKGKEAQAKQVAESVAKLLPSGADE
jgi:hypothetical protein